MRRGARGVRPSWQEDDGKLVTVGNGEVWFVRSRRKTRFAQQVFVLSTKPDANIILVPLLFILTKVGQLKTVNSHTQLPEDHVQPAVPVRSNTACANAALRSSSSRLPASFAHRHAATASCTSPKLLIPTTTGILLPAAPAPAPASAPVPSSTLPATRRDHATATPATCPGPTARTASAAAARTASGAGCHTGGALGGGARRPMPSGEAARTCGTRARRRRAVAKGGSVLFWRVRCA
jgi:hypothetical protein